MDQPDGDRHLWRIDLRAVEICASVKGARLAGRDDPDDDFVGRHHIAAAYRVEGRHRAERIAGDFLAMGGSVNLFPGDLRLAISTPRSRRSRGIGSAVSDPRKTSA